MKKFKFSLVTMAMASLLLSFSCQSQNKGNTEASSESDTTKYDGYSAAELMAAEREAAMEFDDDSTMVEDDIPSTSEDTDTNFGSSGTLQLELESVENPMSPTKYTALYGSIDETFLRFRCYPHSKFGKRDFAEFVLCANLKKPIAHISVNVPSYVELEGKRYKVERATVINNSRQGCPMARRIVLPSTVEKIKIWGFNDLKEVVIGEGLVELNERAFRGCPDLESIVLPNSIEKIGKLAFENCPNLKKIHIPASVNDVCDGAAFAGLNKGVTIEVEKGCEALNELKPIKFDIRGDYGYEHFKFDPENINVVYVE